MQFRLFIAVVPPDAVLNSLCDFSSAVRSRTDGAHRLSWEKRENLHVTLRFIGQVDEVGLAATKNALRTCVPAMARCSARISAKPRVFGDRVLNMSVNGLDSVAAKIVNATSDIGNKPDIRPFRAHVTLARARRGTSVPYITDTMEPVIFPVDSIKLMESTRTEVDNSIVYKTLETYPFSQDDDVCLHLVSTHPS